MKSLQKTFIFFIIGFSLNTNAQFNYFNFNTALLNTTPFTSTGNGLLLSPSNELYYRSAYGYMGLAYVSGSSWAQNIIWGTQAPKTTSEFAFGDNKVFYTDENNRLRMLYWDASGGTWRNYELNYSSPASSGEGLVFAGNSTLYYRTTTGSICRVYNIGYPTYAWNFENITSGSSGSVNAKSGSPLVYGDSKVIYIDNSGRVRQLVYLWGAWQNGEMNTSSPAAKGDALYFGPNSSIYYSNTSGNISYIYYSGSWNYNTVTSAVGIKSGSKIVGDQSTLYYVGTDGYLYTLFQDNCDWFNKKIDKTAVPKPEAICWGNNQLFFRNNSDNNLYNSKTKTSTSQPYVYLKGKTFYNGAQPFYPVVMNYMVNLNSNDDGPWSGNPSAPEPALTSLWVSPDHQIYPSNVCTATDQASANVFLDADFHRLKNLGFNTIRVVGMDVQYNKTGKEDTKIRVMNEPGANHFFTTNYTANNKSKLFTAISNLLTVAQNNGLKVILLSGGGYIHRNTADPADPTAAYGLAYSNYASYLSDLATNCNSSQALLGYDIVNEPGNMWDVNNGKSTNCSQSKTWYDALRNYDPNHLITLGVFGRDDLMNWDPNILSVDFHSFHDYGWPFDSNLGLYQDRYLAKLQWIKNNIKTPWIIGETSVSAIDNAIDNGNINCSYNNVFGWNTESEQQQFAIFSQTKTRSAGGSGYSWWAYHDITHDANSPSEAFEGIYSLCDRKKVAADEFNGTTHNWLSYPCNNLPAATHLAYYGYDQSTVYQYTLTGTVLEWGTNVPLVDALVMGKTGGTGAANYFTFTKAGGAFTLCTNDPNPIARVDFGASGKDMAINWNPAPVSWANVNMGPMYLVNTACTLSNLMREATTVTEYKNNESIIEVYPNPSSNYIVVRNNFTNNFKVEIFDMLGKQLFTHTYPGENYNVKIDYNEQVLSNNFVIIKVSDGNTTVNKKVLIMN